MGIELVAGALMLASGGCSLAVAVVVKGRKNGNISKSLFSAYAICLTVWSLVLFGLLWVPRTSRGLASGLLFLQVTSILLSGLALLWFAISLRRDLEVWDAVFAIPASVVIIGALLLQPPMSFSPAAGWHLDLTDFNDWKIMIGVLNTFILYGFALFLLVDTRAALENSKLQHKMFFITLGVAVSCVSGLLFVLAYNHFPDLPVITPLGNMAGSFMILYSFKYEHGKMPEPGL